MFVYTVTSKSNIESIFSHGFSREFLGDNEGIDYGKGVYVNLSLKDSLNRLSYTRNGCIIRSVLDDSVLDRYLIFDGHLASKVYGSTNIEDQIFKLFTPEDAKDLWNDIKGYMKRFPDAKQTMHGRTAGLLQYMMSKRLHPNTHNCTKYEKMFLKNNIHGAIYRGNKDGFCLVAYNFTDIIPESFTTDGFTFKKKEYEGPKTDVIKKYHNDFDKIFQPVPIDLNGKKTYFSLVQKDGKSNYINIETDELISPIYFDDAALINPQNGVFTFTINGEHLKGTMKGFFDNNNLLPYSELEKYVEFMNIDDNFDFTFENKNTLLNIIVEKAVKKVLKQLNEDITDEEKYLNYEIPSYDDFGKTGGETYLYHVTKSHLLDSIFEFKFDREFTGQQGNVFGEGVYTTTNINDARTLLSDWYGHTIVKTILIGGYDRFLFFDRDASMRLTGQYKPILEQLENIIGDKNIAYQLYKKNGNNIKSYYYEANKYNIRGTVYPWNGVIAVLPFDFSCLVPYSYSVDGGKTFIKKFDNKTYNRIFTGVDVAHTYGDKYSKIDKPVAGLNKEGQPTGISRVRLKGSGKYNFIDTQTGETLIPIDLDGVSAMYDDKFQFEYNGIDFIGKIDGFFDDNNKLHPYEGIDSYIDFMAINDDDFNF